MDFLLRQRINEMFMGHFHWRGVQEVVARLKEKGFQAWLAGGCVRDLLLGRIANDFDVATNALPDQVEAIFARSIAVGKAFGVMVVPFDADGENDGYQVEVTTFRSDGEYRDGRHPEKVTFSSPAEDARRRDFTINALFFDLDKNQVIDFVGGQEDLRRRTIRCVGAPSQRFAEDQLRVLRAVRFAAQLGFAIDEPTWKAVVAQANQMSLVSAERVREEWNKLLLSDHPAMGLQLLEFSGLWDEIFPLWRGVAADHQKWLAVKTGTTEGSSLEERMTALLFQLSRDAWPDVGELKDQSLVDSVTQAAGDLVRQALAHLKYSNNFYKELGRRMAARKLQEFKPRLRRGCQRLVWEENIPSPWLTGVDLKKLGFSPGPQFGELLREAYLRQLEGVDSAKEAQIKWLRAQQAN